MKRLLSRCVPVTLAIGAFFTFSAVAQNYAPGQAVEVDMAGIGSWEAGTVVPFLPGDRQDGYLVRVKVPNYSLYPDGMLVQKIHMRPSQAAPAAAAPAPDNQGNAPAQQPPQAWQPVQQQPARPPAAPPRAVVPPANRNAPARPRNGFQPGDRVEIDKANINSWEGAIVIPFMDRDPRDGSMVRIRIDGYTITPHGLLVPVDRLRAAAGGAQVASYNIGDRVDALSNGLWHDATIIEKKGIDQYKVRYDGGGNVNEEWVDPAGIKPAGQATGARGGPGGLRKAARNPEGGGMTPQLNKGLPVIPGSGWNVLSITSNGKTTVAKSAYQTFSFSKDGRWSITHYSLAAGQIGTYKVQGNRLIMTNNLDGLVQNYAMNWKAGENIMELDNGSTSMRLQLCSTNAYGEK